MAGSTHILKTILIPLFLAALLYLLLAHLLLPFIRRHRTRYAQYLPLTLPSSPDTTTWRTTLSDALYNLFAPRSWRAQQPITHHDDEDEDDFDDEEGEGMVGFDPIDERRREALEQRRSFGGAGGFTGSGNGNGGGGGIGIAASAVYEGAEQRVGRELEEGFRDESDDESEDEQRRRSLVRGRR